ncbi:hypothetical protein [Pseudonocardia hydrocarbonoxydans]|uniref:Uncharacterized protein n=1 Tax=Pseudonocardia hydrocarbonoxydans TaxID=76726 RepID=A0A4Y3WLQ7_9PSEU|nr:hypothetical protein [Pseudonocardia hydrocarbonoxydans]GEC18316.1 hypothetical protein PHY01_05990 [Pseudonocardia hydrocarbonoxydans]
MTKQRRVAVTSPQTSLVIARRRAGVRVDPPHLAPADMDRARRVHREQLRRALGAVAGLAGLIIGLPLALFAFPALDAVRLLGVPVSWLAVAVLPYAVLVLLAGWQLRRAEEAEE